MKLKQVITGIIVCCAVLGIYGCMPKLDSKTYGRDEIKDAQRVALGTIVNLRPVNIQGSMSGVGGGSGAVAGAIGGGVAGNSAGDGVGAAVGAVIGAVAGGVIGVATEEGFTRTEGVEMVVRMDGDEGRFISVVQEVDPEQIIKVGDRVYIITNNYNKVRVAQTGENIATAKKKEE